MVFDKNKYDATDESTILSEWNEAAFQMRRLDVLQSTINQVSLNLPVFYELSGDYGYNIKLRAVSQLLAEVDSKLTEPERTAALAKKKIVVEFLKKHPIHESKTDCRKPTRKIITLNRIDLFELDDLLDDYDRHVRMFLETHHIRSRKEDDEEGL